MAALIADILIIVCAVVGGLFLAALVVVRGFGATETDEDLTTWT